MPANSNTLTLTIEVDDKGSLKVKQFAGEVDKAVKQTSATAGQGAAAMGSAAAGTGRLASALSGLTSAGGLAGIALGLVTKSGIAAAFALAKAADQAAASQKRFDLAFQGQAQMAAYAADMLEKYYRMSRSEAVESMAGVQTLMTGMGMAAGKASSFALEVNKLSADLANFNRVPTAQTMRDIEAALEGSYGGLKKYGIVINEQTVSQQALRLGLASTKEELTSAHKAYAAFTLVVERSKNAIGEGLKDNYARQLIEFENRWNSLTKTLGTSFLPVALEVLRTLNAIAEAARRFVVPTKSEMYDRIASDTAADADRWKLIAETYAKYPQMAGAAPGMPRVSAAEAERTWRELQRRSHLMREMAEGERAAADGFGVLRSRPGEINLPAAGPGDFTANPAAALAAAKKAEDARKKLWAGYKPRASQESEAVLADQKAYEEWKKYWSDYKPRLAESQQSEAMLADQKTWEEWHEKTKKQFDGMIALSEQTARSMQQNFSNLFFDALTGELKSFGDYATAIFRSIQRAFSDVAGQMMTQGLFGQDFKGGGALSDLGKWFQGLKLGGDGGASAPAGWASAWEHHGGGTIGADRGLQRTIPAWMIAAAPRLHNGLRPDEYPAVLQLGEEVRSRRQVAEDRRGGSGLTVKVYNQGSEPVQVEDVRETRNPDGSRNLEFMIGRALTSGGTASRMVQGTMPAMTRKPIVRN